MRLRWRSGHGATGSTGTNAAAESQNSLYEKELIEREGPWAGTADVMLATLEWVAWYNRERLHSACGYVPPEEFEETTTHARGIWC
jgi:putative transposase